MAEGNEINKLPEGAEKKASNQTAHLIRGMPMPKKSQNRATLRLAPLPPNGVLGVRRFRQIDYRQDELAGNQ
jgi:hypothetical protein